MRFEVRFSNGFWKLFDTHAYTGVAWYELHKDAVIDCAAANKNFG
jgi:hypothetical protein